MRNNSRRRGPVPESLLEDSDPLKVTAAAGGIFVCSPNEGVKPDNQGRAVLPRNVYWMMKLTTFSGVRSTYGAFRNHGRIRYSYGDLYLMVELPGVEGVTKEMRVAE